MWQIIFSKSSYISVSHLTSSSYKMMLTLPLNLGGPGTTWKWLFDLQGEVIKDELAAPDSSLLGMFAPVIQLHCYKEVK